MQRLIGRLMGSLGEVFGWRRAILVVQDESGAVAWWMVPADEPLSLRVNTDDSLSITLGHRDSGDAFLAELETLLESRAANEVRVSASRSRRGGSVGLDASWR